MEEIVKPIAEYINTALGAAALGGAAFAANWIRKVVIRYFLYIEAKVARWSTKRSVLITPEMRSAMEVAAAQVLQKMIQERKDRARTSAR